MRHKNILLLSFLVILSFALHCLPLRYLPKSDQRAFHKAQELYHQGKKDQALGAFKSFTSQFSQSTFLSEALFYIGIIYSQKKEPKKALEYFDQSLRQTPSVHLQYRIYLQSGLSCFQLNNYRIAIKYYENALRLSSGPEERAVVSLLLARSYQNIGNLSQALKEYLSILTYNPGMELKAKAKDGLINSILKMKSTDELKHLKEKIDLGEEIRGYAYYRLGELYFSSHEHEAAHKVFKEYMRLFPNHPYQEKAAALFRKTEELIHAISQAHKERIGCILPLSGKYGLLGQKILNGIKLAFLTTPLPTGKDGYRLIVKDSGSIPQNAISLLEELAIQEKVLVVIGPVFNEALKNANPISAKYHVPLVSPTAADGDMFQPGPYLFRTIPNIRQSGRHMADYAIRKLYLTTFAILYPNTSYGIQLQESFGQRVLKLGGHIGKILSYESASSDLAPQLKDLIDKEDGRPLPQALFLPEDYYGLRLIAPQLAYYFQNQMVLLSCCYKEPPQISDIKRGKLEGAIFMTEFFAASSVPEIKAFMHNFKKTFGKEPDYWAAQGYDAANMIFHIFQHNKVQSREAVRDSLLGIEDFSGVTGKVTVLPNGAVEKMPFMLKVVRGKFVQLD